MDRHIVTHGDFAVELFLDPSSKSGRGLIWLMPQAREIGSFSLSNTDVQINGDLPWRARRGLTRAIQRAYLKAVQR